MAIITSVNAPFNFLVSEANDWRSRDEVSVSAEGATEDVLVGTIVMGDTGETPGPDLLPWDGTGDAAGILCQSVAAGEIAQRTIIARDAEVVGADLVLPEGTDVEDATTALAALGIIVRTNKGQIVDVVDAV